MFINVFVASASIKLKTNLDMGFLGGGGGGEVVAISVINAQK